MGRQNIFVQSPQEIDRSTVDLDLESRWFSGALFLVSAVFHLISLGWPGLSIPEPPIEHLIFFVLNTFVAYVLTFGEWRNSAVSLIVVPLAIEQWVEHLPRLMIAMSARLPDLDEKGVLQNLLTLLFISLVTIRQLVFQFRGREVQT